QRARARARRDLIDRRGRRRRRHRGAATATAAGQACQQRGAREQRDQGLLVVHGSPLHFAPGSGVSRYGNFGSRCTAAWSTASCSFSEVLPSGTLAGLQSTPRPSALLSPLAMHSPPITATSAMSTTSSFGRRPFGKPALSPLSTPSRPCCASGVAGVLVFGR